MGKRDASAAEAVQLITTEIAGSGSLAGERMSASGRRIVLDGPFAESKELLARAFGLPPPGRYAIVNGLRMYYEVHDRNRGRDRPVVLLHGALTTIDSSFGAVVQALACTRRVIAVEQQAHGRTDDIDRRLSYEQMADDTAELLHQLEVDRADVFGFSMGGLIALELAVRHPERVRKLAVVSGGFSNDGYRDDALDMLLHLDPRDISWSGKLRRDFQSVGADPGLWPAAVSRIKQATHAYRGLRPRDLRAIRAETLFVTAEHGWIRRDHVDEMVRSVPDSLLKVFPGDDHDPLIVRRSASLIPAFLDARS